MIEITMEVRNDTGRFLVAVCAESILHAVKRAEGTYWGANLSVVFPLDPETFFSGDDAEATLEELELSEGRPSGF